jgi:NADPH2:quinone reductase
LAVEHGIWPPIENPVIRCAVRIVAQDGAEVSVSQEAIAQVMTASNSARVAPSRACTDRPCTTLGASLAATKRVTGRIIVYGLVGGEAAITNWELVYKHQIHVIGLNIGILIRAAPQIFGEVMGQLFGLLAAGVLGPGQPTIYELAEGPKALAELEARATVGKLALRP